MWIDESFSWKQHIFKIGNKIRSNLFLIQTNKDILPKSTRLLMYNTLIKPHLEYGIAIWGGKLPEKLITLQKRAIRTVAGVRNMRKHTDELFNTLKVLKLKDLFELNCAKIAFKAINKLLPNELLNICEPINHNKCTRSQTQGKVIVPPHKTKVDECSIFVMAPTTWNNLQDEETNSPTLSTFSVNLKKKFISTYTNKCEKKNCYGCR